MEPATWGSERTGGVCVRPSARVLREDGGVIVDCAVYTDGKRRAVAVDASGKPRVSLKPGHDWMGIDELVQASRAVFPSSFVGENASGSGSAQHGAANNNGGGKKLRIPRSDQAAINANWQAIARGEAEVV